MYDGKSDIQLRISASRVVWIQTGGAMNTTTLSMVCQSLDCALKGLTPDDVIEIGEALARRGRAIKEG